MSVFDEGESDELLLTATEKRMDNPFAALLNSGGKHLVAETALQESPPERADSLHTSAATEEGKAYSRNATAYRSQSSKTSDHDSSAVKIRAVEDKVEGVLKTIALPGGVRALEAEDFDVLTYLRRSKQVLPLVQFRDMLRVAQASVKLAMAEVVNKRYSQVVTLGLDLRQLDATQFPKASKVLDNARSIVGELHDDVNSTKKVLFDTLDEYCELQAARVRIERDIEIQRSKAEITAALSDLPERLDGTISRAVDSSNAEDKSRMSNCKSSVLGSSEDHLPQIEHASRLIQRLLCLMSARGAEEEVFDNNTTRSSDSDGNISSVSSEVHPETSYIDSYLIDVRRRLTALLTKESLRLLTGTQDWQQEGARICSNFASLCRSAILIESLDALKADVSRSLIIPHVNEVAKELPAALSGDRQSLEAAQKQEQLFRELLIRLDASFLREDSRLLQVARGIAESRSSEALLPLHLVVDLVTVPALKIATETFPGCRNLAYGEPFWTSYKTGRSFLAHGLQLDVDGHPRTSDPQWGAVIQRTLRELDTLWSTQVCLSIQLKEYSRAFNEARDTDAFRIQEKDLRQSTVVRIPDLELSFYLLSMATTAGQFLSILDLDENSFLRPLHGEAMFGGDTNTKGTFYVLDSCIPRIVRFMTEAISSLQHFVSCEVLTRVFGQRPVSGASKSVESAPMIAARVCSDLLQFLRLLNLDADTGMFGRRLLEILRPVSTPAVPLEQLARIVVAPLEESITGLIGLQDGLAKAVADYLAAGSADVIAAAGSIPKLFFLTGKPMPSMPSPYVVQCFNLTRAFVVAMEADPVIPQHISSEWIESGLERLANEFLSVVEDVEKSTQKQKSTLRFSLKRGVEDGAKVFQQLYLDVCAFLGESTRFLNGTDTIWHVKLTAKQEALKELVVENTNKNQAVSVRT